MFTKIIHSDQNDNFMASLARTGHRSVNALELSSGVKQAASDLVSRELLEKHRPESDKHMAIHLIAMGASDTYGYNKNGDWFGEDALTKYSHTFMDGHMFQEHNNRDPKHAIGSVKFAAYDPVMKRVEIICHLDRDKRPELAETVKQGGDLSFSMSCTVPYDVCSCCGNNAKGPRNYCSHLRHGMGRWDDQHQKYAYAINDHPKFFDISEVKNPADRIARGLAYLFPEQENVKAASAEGLLIPSAYEAQEIGLTIGSGPDVQEQNVIVKLASSEEFVEGAVCSEADPYTDVRIHRVTISYPRAITATLSQPQIDKVRAIPFPVLMGGMQRCGCMFNLPSFCQVVSGQESVASSPMVQEVARMMPDIFRHMKSTMYGSDCGCVSGCFDGEAPSADLKGEVDDIMRALEKDFSLKAEIMGPRISTIIINSDDTKKTANYKNMDKKAAHDNQEAHKIAMAYASYQVKCASTLEGVSDIEDIISSINAAYASI